MAAVSMAPIFAPMNTIAMTQMCVGASHTMLVLIDNGHGAETAGKRSPDGRLREWRYTREIAAEVVRRLREKGYDARRLVPETTDVPLAERCRRVNRLCATHGAAHVLLVSVHVNAAGNGQWLNARGWSAWTSRGHTAGDMLADSLYAAARRHLGASSVRADYSDGDADFEAGFYILRHTRCAAALTENLFMDNRSDMERLLSAEGREAIIRLHVDGIADYVRRNRG